MKALITRHIDTDGLMSGLITKVALEAKGYEVETIAWNYGWDLPNYRSYEYDVHCMVDISLPPHIMKDLMEEGKTCWIDHHISAINNSIEHGYETMPGHREVGPAACELCWNYFFKNDPCPEIVQIFSAYDVFDKDRFDWKGVTLPYQYGFREVYGTDFDLLCEDANKMLSGDPELLSHLFEVGQSTFIRDMNRYMSAAKNNSWPITVAGKYKGVALLTTDSTSLVFDSIADEYDVYLTMNFNNKVGLYKFSLSTDPGKIDMNLAEYVKTKNPSNGGHFSIGAGYLTEEEFIDVIRTKTF